MIYFELSSVPNQTFTTTLNGYGVEFYIRSFRGLLYCTINLNDGSKWAGARAITDMSIFPAWINRKIGGRLMFVGDADEYPDYTQFADGGFRLAYEEGVFE